MSSAEQKELKEKLYFLYFYKQLFQGFNIFFFSKILLHGIHGRPERQLRCGNIFKQPGEKRIYFVDTIRLLW